LATKASPAAASKLFRWFIENPLLLMN